MLLLIDNYDSFVHNLARYFQRLGQETHVVRNDRLTVAECGALGPAAIVLSPGPCTPREAGVSLELVQELHESIPMLGVCLGHQTLVAALGGHVVRAPAPVHGVASVVRHDGRGMFQGVSSPLTVGRYHSLVADAATLPDTLQMTAHTEDDLVMAVRHRVHACVGVQFHPELILTEDGYSLLANFLRLAGCDVALPLPDWTEECSPDRAPTATADWVVTPIPY